jgi:hypothetical protein
LDARSRGNEVIRRIAQVVSFVMPLVVLLLMVKRAVNVPFLDEWSWAELSVTLHRGTLTWPMIAAQHNEHRNLVANLIFLGIDRSIGWNILAEQLVSFALLAVAQIAAWLLVRATTAPARCWPLFAVISLLLWSLAQWENFALGYNVGWNVCTAALFVLLAALAPRVDATRVLIALAATLVATFASAQGVLLMPIGLVLVARDARLRWPATIIWSVAAAAMLVAFLHGYEGVPSGSAPPLLAFVVYFLAVLGTPIGAWWGLSGSVAVGALGLIGFGILAWRCRTESLALTVWSCAAFYAIANAVLIAASRFALGFDSALSSHYAALALFLYVAVAGLAAAAWEPIVRTSRWVLIAAGVIIAYGVLDADLHGNRAWQLYTIARHDEVCALARHDDAALVTLADADTGWVEREAADLVAVNDLPYRDALGACAAATPPR